MGEVKFKSIHNFGYKIIECLKEKIKPSASSKQTTCTITAIYKLELLTVATSKQAKKSKMNSK